MDYSKYLDYCPVTGNLIWKETRGRLAKKGEITGVRWHKQSKKRQARIRVDKQLMSLGLYVNLDDAVKAREAANLKYGFHDNHGKGGM